MPELSGVPGSGESGLRAANARLRELLAGRDARIAELAAENAALREALAELQSQVEGLAAQVKANSRNSSKPPSSDGLAKPSPKSLRGKSGRKPGRPRGQPGATMELSGHPDHSASAGKFALFTVHAKRGKDGMKGRRGPAVLRRHRRPRRLGPV